VDNATTRHAPAARNFPPDLTQVMAKAGAACQKANLKPILSE
jgi:hypothetical protein